MCWGGGGKGQGNRVGTEAVRPERGHPTDHQGPPAPGSPGCGRVEEKSAPHLGERLWDPAQGAQKEGQVWPTGAWGRRKRIQLWGRWLKPAVGSAPGQRLGAGAGADSSLTSRVPGSQ